MTVALHRQLHTTSYASWNLDIYNLFAQYDTLAMAIGATGLNLLACSLAVRTDRFGLHTTKEAVNHLHYTATAVTFSTSLKLGPILCSGTMAMRTLNVFLYFEMLLNASNHISQTNLDTNTNG